MFNIIQKVNAPDALVVTPLLPGHKIFRDTKINLKRCDLAFDWVSYVGHNNIPANATLGLQEYIKRFSKTPKYMIMIDRDIIPSRNMLKYMFDTLENSSEEVAYCYSSFEFKGAINARFVGLEFDPLKLLESNYISSNSMIKIDKLQEIGGFVIDQDLVRLLDWALWLKFLHYGYVGVLCKSSFFTAISSPDSVSARGREDYALKYGRVRDRFVRPLLDGLVL